MYGRMDGWTHILMDLRASRLIDSPNDALEVGIRKGVKINSRATDSRLVLL